VHKAGDRGHATFKWSRDNGFVVTRIKTIDNNALTVEDTGKDAVLGFAPNQWVEIVDDDLELMGIPGQLVQVDTVNPGPRRSSSSSYHRGEYEPKREGASLGPKRKCAGLEDGIKLSSFPSFAGLEDGIEVQFADGTSTYRTGDYWLVPARSSLGDIEWPQPGKPSQPVPKTPDGFATTSARWAF